MNLTPYILLAPLVGFLALGLFGRALPRLAISLIGCGTVLVAFGLAIADFAYLLGQPAQLREVDTGLGTWISAGTLHIPFGLLNDPLSAIMLLIVTGVGFLIHVYSIGYMEGDPGYWRFFSFMNLFIFTMALLVAADNFLFLLVGWAGVGLASFLLIGYWYTRPSAVAAARKAFVVNVIGDFGLMLAIFMLFNAGSTDLSYQRILGIIDPRNIALSSPALPAIQPLALSLAIPLLLIVAAIAKSAQLPLHVWLPDAMEGPTPVSALIHAATMVTAGVYLIARTHVLFTAFPDALTVVAIIGGASAFFAATIACAQTDIKRILAYSTMSQLAYMFMGEAAGGFSSGIFHLVTHAFFKALLFMCAGAVIHALGGEQDIRKMGGLRQRLGGVFWLFVVSGLALAAIFPFAGFWSKDTVLGAVLAKATATGAPGWWLLYATGLATAALTGFYIFRLIFVTFLGDYRGPALISHGDHAGGEELAGLHKPGLAMTMPMYILGLLSIIGGAINLPAVIGLPGASWLSDFLATTAPSAPELATTLFWVSLAASLVCALAGVGYAWARYGAGQIPVTDEAEGGLVAFLRRRWYVDDIYDGAIVRPALSLSRLLRQGVEDEILDAGAKGTGDAFDSFSAGLRGFQTGYLRNYALTVFLGVIIILVYFISVTQ